jgi:omega-3 fatty acid desaturase (delta-15 desaturase)
LTGTVMWMNFVIGHDCGHGSFSTDKALNAVVGHVTHAPLLVPFWPWAYSHKQHHRFHNHETKDMSHPWMTAERYQATNPIVRFLALDHWWGAFLGFPGYLLLEQKSASTDGSHFYPGSRLFDRAPKDERLKCAVSTVSCVSFLAATCAVTDSFTNWSMQYLAPYLCFSWWLFAVTYLQHHDEDTETYAEGEWEYVLGGLQTIDREFGLGIDRATHHITDCHVAHHMFSDMPHYRLETATEAVRGVLEPRGLYKRRDTRDFVAKTFALHESVGHCVERDRPRATRGEIEACLFGETNSRVEKAEK